jgi:PAS domain-containing protein
MATLAAVTNMPALGLLGEDGRLERSTEPFRRWYEDREELCLESPEVKRLLEGQANAAVLKLDGIAVDIAAMADRDDGRHLLLTLPVGELPSLGDAGGALLDGALDESPALVWLKDLEGRYVRANSRFTTLLNTSEERLVGRTDGELPAAETVDGPRAQDREGGIEEPLQLEYAVGPYQGREALVVLRFPVGDSRGVPLQRSTRSRRAAFAAGHLGLELAGQGRPRLAQPGGRPARERRGGGRADPGPDRRS